MDINKAIDELKYQEDMRSKGIEYQVNNLVVYEAVEALEKQVRQKVIKSPKYGSDRCPRCNGNVFRSYHFCSQCGQKLDWNIKETF